MSRRNSLFSTFVVLVPFVWMACSQDNGGQNLDKSDLLGKSDAANVCAKFGQPPPPACDLCADQGWYDDGTCDAALIAEGLCKGPDPDCGCTIDADCPAGSEWCEAGACVACDNSGLACLLYCENGFVERNGCFPCQCAEPEGCVDDSDCGFGSEWCEAGACVSCDNSGLSCMLYCEHGMIERNGCYPCQCAEPEGCTDDSECASGAEWCEASACIPCDNSGLWCELYCEDGFIERNGCIPCQCIQAGACTGDSECTSGSEWCEAGACVACDNSGLWCELYCENGMVERNGCTPCECL